MPSSMPAELSKGDTDNTQDFDGLDRQGNDERVKRAYRDYEE